MVSQRAEGKAKPRPKTTSIKRARKLIINRSNKPPGGFPEILGACAPTPMHEALDWREQNFVGNEADDNDQDHDAHDGVDGMQFAAIMKQVPKAETGQNRY